MHDSDKTPMPILPQIFPVILAIYWQTLASFYSEIICADLLGRCRSHLLVKIAENVDFSELEAACAGFHHQVGAGRPVTYPIASLVRAFLVGWLYDLSLRELEQRLCSDLLVRWFVRLPLFTPVPDHTTLERFEQWVTEHQARAFFDTVILQITAAFPKERERPQIGDTYAMRADAADENLVGRLRHLSRQLLVELTKALPGAAENSLKGFEWVQLFGVHPEKQGCFLDDMQRKERLSETALAADELHRRVERLLSEYSCREHTQVRQWLGYLSKVMNDEISLQVNEAGEKLASELRKKDKGAFRIISGGDPEATLRVHDDDITLGYNAQVAISAGGFICETSVDTGACPDQAGVAKLIADQIENQGSCPPKLIYDKAGGNGKTRAEVVQVSQGQCMVSAKLPDYEQRSQCFGPYDFTLSDDKKSLTCPGGKVSTHAYSVGSQDGVYFRFYASQCWNGDPPTRAKASCTEACARRCPFWEQCRTARQGSETHRMVFISDYRDNVLAAREYNQSEEFGQDMKLRPLVERVIFELTHYNGARRCRRRGMANADFQAKMCATAYNLKLWMRRLTHSHALAV